MCICAYMCMCIGVYVYALCVCLYGYVCIYAYIYVSLCVHPLVCVLWMPACMNGWMYRHVCTCVCLCLSACIQCKYIFACSCVYCEGVRFV